MPAPEDENPFVLSGPIITGIRLVDRITRLEKGAYQSVSLPGHLIHVVVEGRVEQQAAGIQESICAGDAVWYVENEEIHGRIVEAPWTFYTINFTSPTVIAPPCGGRVQPIAPDTVDRVIALLAHWRDMTVPSATRHLRVYALLLEILLDLMPPVNAAYRTDAATQLWWEVEAQLRRDLSAPINMRYLERLSHRSAVNGHPGVLPRSACRR